MEHPGPVVPVGEHPLVRPPIAHDVAQSERLQVGQRRALGRRDVGLADVGVRIEHVVVGRARCSCRRRRRRPPGPLRPSSRSAASQASLYSVVLGVRHAPVGHVDRDHADPAARGRHRARLGMREARRRRRARARRRPGRRARGSPRRSTRPRRGRRPRSRARRARRRAASANASSASFVSCRQTTSGRRSSSQGSSRGRRCLTELTFQVAIRTDPTVAVSERLPEPWGRGTVSAPCMRRRRLGPAAAGGGGGGI